MTPKFHNTLSQTKDALAPLSDNVVKIYTCGLTVYSQPHVGNWLGYIYWDVLVRLLRDSGYTVERTQNITDVGHLVSDDDTGEDKMEKGARAEGTTAWDIAEKYIAVADHEAYDLLGLVRPDHLVRATDYIDQQVAFARILEQKGFTYTIDGEGLYFDTSKLYDYGKLARLDIAGLEPGARVSVEGKKNPTDFAIWKFSPVGVKRDMEWDSPWGKGFPGWHLECSVIARETLGDQIDIHTGGIDHIPVHHTNEIAQTEAVTDKQFAQIWLHNNHIKVDGQKISKSLGNIFTLQDITDHGFSLMAYKLMALSKHYRTEGNFTWDILQASQNRLDSWREVAALRWQVHDTIKAIDSDLPSLAAISSIKSALADDLNTPEALRIIDQVFSELQAHKKKIEHHNLVQLLETIDNLLGLDLMASTPDIDEGAKQKILVRERARENEDWQASDKLRDELAGQGIAVRDTASGAVWYYS